MLDTVPAGVQSSRFDRSGSELVMLVAMLWVWSPAQQVCAANPDPRCRRLNLATKKTLHEKTQLYALAWRQPEALAHLFHVLHSVATLEAREASLRDAAIYMTRVATTSCGSAHVSTHFAGPEARRRQ